MNNIVGAVCQIGRSLIVDQALPRMQATAERDATLGRTCAMTTKEREAKFDQERPDGGGGYGRLGEVRVADVFV